MNAKETELLRTMINHPQILRNTVNEHLATKKITQEVAEEAHAKINAIAKESQAVLEMLTPKKPKKTKSPAE